MRRKLFLVLIALILMFSVIGQCGIDEIGLSSDFGTHFGYERLLPYMLVTVAVTCAAITLVFLAIRQLLGRKGALGDIARVLRVALCVWMLVFSGFYVLRAIEPDGVYGVADLWLGYVDVLEEERRVWDKSRWFGHGEEVYETDFDEFVEAENHLSLKNPDEEPYHSVTDERYRMWYVFRSCGSKTMINVLSYFYGKWVWLLWCLLAVCSVAVGASMLPAVGSKPARTLYLSALLLFGTMLGLTGRRRGLSPKLAVS